MRARPRGGRIGPPPRAPHTGARAITARSTGPGRSSTDATQGTPSMVLACGLTAYTGPVKPPVTMLRRMARPSVPPCLADHGDRSRPQQRAQAGHVRPAFPAGHRLQVTAQPVIVFAIRQGEGQLDHLTGYPPLRGQAGIREDAQHRGVLGQRLCEERRRPRCRASQTRCSSSRLAMPRPCTSSGTANATSARPGFPASS